ncbi:MAG: GntR family transcriptional regulator [Polaromonas sp.]|nr:GntR family transcriptional regulator [Polaromonas sp.]
MALFTSPVIAHFHRVSQALPKHARLRQAVVDAIEARDLNAGDKLPGERELSEALGLSLGTTQKALGQLMTEGFLLRKQGHGTFVGSERRPISGTWHFRFVSPDGGHELPVFSTITERSLLQEPGVWSNSLGLDPKGYVRVNRRLDVDGKFTCLSQMYLGASRFSRLLRMAEKRLADVNLKAVLELEFAAPTLRSEGLATLVVLRPDEAASLGLQPGATGLQIHIVGRSFGRAPISFQRVLIPPTAYSLKLDFHGPDDGDSQSPSQQPPQD